MTAEATPVTPSKPHRLKQMSRIIKTAFLIKNNPSVYTRQGLSNLFNVDKTTIQRDINMLREMGITIAVDGKQGYKFVSGYEFMEEPETDPKGHLQCCTTKTQEITHSHHTTKP